MATVADALRVVAAETHTLPGRVKHYIRRLQESGLLPLASGSAVPSIRITHLVALLIAVATDCAAKDTVSTVRTYSDLRRGGFDVDLMPASIRPPAFHAADYLAEILYVLASGTAEEQRDYADVQVEFVANWPEISIRGPASPKPLRFVEPGKLSTHWQSDSMRRSTVLTGRALQRLVRTLRLTR